MNIISRWAILSFTILATPYLIPGVEVESIGAALAAALVLGFINIFLKPLLIILTLPLTLFTLGFFLLILNAVCFQIAAAFVSGLEVESFFSSFMAALFVSLVSWVTNLGVQRHGGRPRIIIRQSRRHDSGGPRHSSRMKDVTPPNNSD